MTIKAEISRQSEALIDDDPVFTRLPYGQLPESIYQMVGVFNPSDEDSILMGIGSGFNSGFGRTYHYIFHIPVPDTTKKLRVFLNPDNKINKSNIERLSETVINLGIDQYNTNLACIFC